MIPKQTVKWLVKSLISIKTTIASRANLSTSITKMEEICE